MKKVFISSVMTGFEKYRKAAKEAVELMDFKPMMAENFGARAYSSEVACIAEAQGCDIFVLILGEEYGYKTDEGISVTESEYRAAKAAGRPTLVFIQNCKMEQEQEEFKAEVEAYYDGFFRVSFSDENELKDSVIKSLRQYENEGRSEGDASFSHRLDVVLQETSDHSQHEPRGVVAFWGQPTKQYDLDEIESDSDTIFQQLCSLGAAKMSDGYKCSSGTNHVVLQSNKTKFVIYDDGFKVLYFSAEAEDDDASFTMFYVSPSKFEEIAKSSFILCGEKIAWSLVGVLGMENKYFGEPNKGNSSSVPMFNPPSDLASKFLSPITEASFKSWVQSRVKAIKRVYRKDS